MSRDELRALAERCEQATGASYVLDSEIWAATSAQTEIVPPAYTASLDAAMTLVPEGCRLTHLGQAPWGRWNASVDSVNGNAATDALALCAAALHARANREPHNDRR